MIYLFTFLACSDNTSDQDDNATSVKTKTSERQTNHVSGYQLTNEEQILLKDHIEDIRKGIRPFDDLPDQSLGICKAGPKHQKFGYITCEEFIGKDARDLPEGNYILYSHFSVPEIEPNNQGWQIEFKRECKTTKTSKNGQSVTTDTYSKSYNLKNYGGKGNHVSPLSTITSPGEYGAKECDWTITLFNTNEKKEISGFWSVPGK